MSTTPLAEGFGPGDHEAWVQAVERTIRGKPLETLVRRTEDGIGVLPLYTKDDAPATATAGVGRTGAWTVLQRHAHPDPKVANAQLLEDLAAGVHGVVLSLASPMRLRGHGPFDGVAVADLDDLDRALDGVWLDAAAVALDASYAWLSSSALLLALWDRREVAAADRRGWFDADPIGAYARLDGDPRSLITPALARLGRLAAATATLAPNVRVALADARPYHDAGGTPAQSIGLVLAVGHAYVEAMVGAGLSVDDAAARVSLQLPLTPDQFGSIAALRALRSTWTRVLELLGASDPAASVEVRACSSARVMTEVDPWVNLLRGTVVGLSAAVGGADVVTIEPFDRMLGEPGALGRRMARNTHVVLAEEAHLARVADPAGGAWYVEAHTEALADAAWQVHQEVLDAGGIVDALGSGLVSGWLHDAVVARDERIRHRRHEITGVTAFPLLGEDLPATSPFVGSDLRGPVGTRLADAPVVDLDPDDPDVVATLRAAVAGGATIPDLHERLWPEAPSANPPRAGAAHDGFGGLPLVRDAAAFETLRRNVEALGSPEVLLANLGPLAEHNARTTFAANAYAVGGFRAVDGGSHDDVDGVVAAFRDSGARAACICASDATYERMAADVAGALKAAGADTVHLAGRFGEHEDAWREAGIDATVGLGDDLFAFLTDLAGALGAALTGVGADPDGTTTATTEEPS